MQWLYGDKCNNSGHISIIIENKCYIDMSTYRIVCTTQEPLDKPHDAAHIVSVGTGSDPDTASANWSLKQVLDAIQSGNSFFTKSPSTGKEASVNKYECKTCGRTTIRSSADAVTDNNLDNLRKCRSFS